MSIKIILETRHIQTTELRLGLVSGLLTSEVAVLISAFNPSQVYCHRQQGWSNTILGLLERKKPRNPERGIPQTGDGKPSGSLSHSLSTHLLINTGGNLNRHVSDKHAAGIPKQGQMHIN